MNFSVLSSGIKMAAEYTGKKAVKHEAEIAGKKLAQNALKEETEITEKKLAKKAVTDAINQSNGYNKVIKNAKGKLRNWCEKEGYDYDRLPRYYTDAMDLPAAFGGGTCSKTNEVYVGPLLKNASKNDKKFTEAVIHEGFHGLNQNLRAAWAHQNPEEFSKCAENTVYNSILKGESGQISKYIVSTVPKDLIKKDLTENLSKISTLPKDKYSDFMYDFYKNLDKYANRSNMYVPAHLTQDGKAAIKEGLYPLMKDSSDAAKQQLSKTIEKDLPCLFKFNRTEVERALTYQPEAKFIDVPAFNNKEKQTVADFFKNEILSKPDSYKIENETKALLTDETKESVKNKLLPALLEHGGYASSIDKTDALKSINDYLEAQTSRVNYLKKESIPSSNMNLPSVSKPLNEKEKLMAKNSLEGYLPTIEGNLKAQADPLTAKNMTDYVFSYEELRARETSYKELLAKAPKDAKGMAFKQQMQTNLDLVDKIKKYQDLSIKINNSGDSIKKEQLQNEYNNLMQEISKLSPNASIDGLPREFFKDDADFKKYTTDRAMDGLSTMLKSSSKSNAISLDDLLKMEPKPEPKITVRTIDESEVPPEILKMMKTQS